MNDFLKKIKYWWRADREPRTFSFLEDTDQLTDSTVFDFGEVTPRTLINRNLLFRWTYGKRQRRK